MLKRILSCILVAALALTALPLTAFAKTNGILYGDVNVDSEVDLNDALMLKRYIAEENPSGFGFVNADVAVRRRKYPQRQACRQEYRPPLLSAYLSFRSA